MKILVTGKSGFVGRNLTEFLTEKGFNLSFVGRTNEENQINWSELEKIESNQEAYIHLAGKAHDLKSVGASDSYYEVNFELSKKIFDCFLASDAKLFIFLSSVKAAADEVSGELTEEHKPNPQTHYGKSKLLAENYMLSNLPLEGKRLIILRPCMIHGPYNKGNLNLLYQIVSKNIPWPLGAFENKRSFCSIDNLLFAIFEIIKQESISSGVYNISDDKALSTNEVISLIGESNSKKARIWKLDLSFISFISRIGDTLKLPLNSERLIKLTESYIVSNKKLKFAIGKPFPISSTEGLLKTFKSF